MEQAQDIGERVCSVRIRQRWEHKTVHAKGAGVFSGKMKTTDIDAVLAREGADGWELVSAFQGSNVSSSLPGVILFFKRPVFMG